MKRVPREPGSGDPIRLLPLMKTKEQTVALYLGSDLTTDLFEHSATPWNYRLA